MALTERVKNMAQPRQDVGFPVLMKVPQPRVMGYTVAISIAALVIFIVISAVNGMLLPPPTL